MKSHIRTKASECLDKLETAKSINEFMTQLTNDFESKNMIRDYTRGIIPAHKKSSVGANNANIKEKDVKVEGWEEKKIPFAKDNEFKAKMKAIIDPKIKDTTNKDKLIWDDEEIKKLHAENKLQSCNSCGSINCRTLYRLTSDPATKKGGQRLGGCSGKPATFGNPDKYAHAYTPSKEKKFGARKRRKMSLCQRPP